MSVSSVPKFKIGDRVRVDTGWDREVIVIIVVSEVYPNHGAVGAHRYYGRDDRGVSHGAGEDQIRGFADGSSDVESEELTLDEYQEKSTVGLSLDEAERRYKERPW